MIHYDEYGNPTLAHTRLCNRAVDLANKTIRGGYVTKLEVVRLDKGVRFKVSILGKTFKRNGKIVSKVMPTKAALDSELVEYAMDEIEMELVRRVLPEWSNATVAERCVYANDVVLIWDFMAYGK